MWRGPKWLMLQGSHKGGWVDAEHPTPLHSRWHSPLHEAPKPGQAADEPLRGVDLLQEVIGEALEDGLHVRGTALHEFHHLKHHRVARGWSG